AVFDDLGVRGYPGGVPAAGTETLLACDPVPTRDHDRLRARGRGVGDDATRRVDPDGARHLVWHPGRVGRKDTTLVNDPGGAGVRLPDLLDHLNTGGQVEFRTAQGAGQGQMEQP